MMESQDGGSETIGMAKCEEERPCQEGDTAVWSHSSRLASVSLLLPGRARKHCRAVCLHRATCVRWKTRILK